MQITAKQGARILREIVEYYGEDTDIRDQDEDGRCVYVNKAGDAVCLIGVALKDWLAVDPGVLIWDNTTISGLWDAVPAVRAVLSREARDLFRTAQGNQDIGVPWGDAVKLACVIHGV